MQASHDIPSNSCTPTPTNLYYFPWTLPFNYNSQLATLNTASPFSQSNTPTASSNNLQDPMYISIQRLESMDQTLISHGKMQSTPNSLQSTVTRLSKKVESMEGRIKKPGNTLVDEKTYRELNSASLEFFY